MNIKKSYKLNDRNGGRNGGRSDGGGRGGGGRSGGGGGEPDGGGRSGGGEYGFGSGCGGYGGELGEGLMKAVFDLRTLTPIKKNLYQEHPVISNLDESEVTEYRNSMEVTVKGRDVPRPIRNFNEGNFPIYVESALQKMCFQKPTPIQAQVWPMALSGRDVLGIAQTGSGKTLGYILPAVLHIRNQPPLKFGEGPMAVVLAPTRELVQQIQTVCNDFGRPCDVWNCSVYGGVDKDKQLKAIKKNVAHICIATPGRLIDYVSCGQISLRKCSYLILDEADRMLDMGFEPQIRKIIEQIRPDRQTLMFSATWPRGVRLLAKDFLVDHIRVKIGSIELCANHNIKQIVDIVKQEDKEIELIKVIQKIMSSGDKDNKTLIFVETKRKVDSLTSILKAYGFQAMGIHSKKYQSWRNSTMKLFRNGQLPILVATDVASRGLDVDDIKFVINFDFPNNSEEYIHRIGRTGRSTKTGTAYTFFTNYDAGQAKDLIAVLEEANQVVNPELKKLAGSADCYGYKRADKHRSSGGGEDSSSGGGKDSSSGGGKDSSSGGGKDRSIRFGKDSSSGGGKDRSIRFGKDCSIRFGSIRTKPYQRRKSGRGLGSQFFIGVK